MTVCIATDGFPPQTGGIATFNKHLAFILNNSGHRVIVLFIDYNNYDEDCIISDGLLTKVLLGKTYQKYYSHWKKYFKPGGFDAPNWIAIGMAMRDWLLKNKNKYSIDIIEVTDYGGPGVFLCSPDLPTVVITGHGSLLQYSRYNYTKKDDHYKVIRKLEELSFKYANAVIAHSPLNKIDLEELLKRKIDFAKIPWHDDIVPTHKQIEKGKLVVVGGMQPIKGIYDIIETMKILLPIAPDIKLNWIGGDTWLAPQHQKMSFYLQKKYPLIWNNNLIWKNELPYSKTIEEIESAEIIVIPAFFETFNYIALEAATLNKPIIITDKTGASFIFTNNKDACIVPFNNPKAMAATIIRLIQKKETTALLGLNAGKIIRTIFDPEKLLQDRMSIYQSAIKNKNINSDGYKVSYDFILSFQSLNRKIFYKILRHIKILIRRR